MAEHEIITSRQNAAVVFALKLTEKKYRDEAGMFRFDGIKLFHEALMCGGVIENVFVREDCKGLIGEADEIYAAGGRIKGIYVLSASAFEKISQEKSPDGIICTAKYLDKLHKKATIYSEENFSAGKTLILCSIRDPGNMGTIMRTAAALGYGLIVTSSDCADVYNPKTLRAAMGAAFRIGTVAASDLAGTIKAVRASGRNVYAAAMSGSGKLLGRDGLAFSDCAVIGNEGHGLPDDVLGACTSTLAIPMKKGNESFNAASAAAMIMWEQSRKDNF